MVAVDPTVVITRENDSGFTARLECPRPELTAVATSEGEFLRVSWSDTAEAGEIGTPALPVVRRLFVAPPGAAVELQWTAGPSTSIALDSAALPWRVIPRQAPVPKLPGALGHRELVIDEASYVADMYSMVWSFACVTGAYTMPECFTETLFRAANKGAVTVYGSSVNSYWIEDDILQRLLFDVIFDTSDDVPSEIGPVWNATNLRFAAYFGAPAPGNNTLRYLEMYNLLGDPSLRLPGNCSSAGSIRLDRNAYSCEANLSAEVIDCDLNLNDSVVDAVSVSIDSDSEHGVETILLVETAMASAHFRGTIGLTTTDAAGALLVADRNPSH